MDEDTARSYCLSFSRHPSSTITQIYRDCPKDSIQKLAIMLASWVYIASEDDMALLDHRIPMSYIQLYQFAHDLGSVSKNPKIVCARCRKALRSQSTNVESLNSLVKVLYVTDSTNEVLFFRAIVKNRLGDHHSAVQEFVNGIMSDADQDELFCNLYSLTLQDLERMKSVLVSMQNSEQKENEFEGGLANGGYIEDCESMSSGIGSSIVSLEIDQQKAKYVLKDLKKSIDVLDDVIDGKSGKGESTVQLASRFVNKGHIYKAACMLLERFPDCTTISGIEQMEASLKRDLCDFCRSVGSSLLLLYSRREKDNSVSLETRKSTMNSCSNCELWDDQMILERGISYSRLCVALAPTDMKCFSMMVRFLVKSGHVTEAIDACDKHISSGAENNELIVALAWCYLHQNRIEESIKLLGRLPEEKISKEAFCLKLLLRLLHRTDDFPFNELSMACKDHFYDMIETACFVGKEGLQRIKSNIRQMISTHLASFSSLDNPVSTCEVTEAEHTLSDGIGSSSALETDIPSNLHVDSRLRSRDLFEDYHSITQFLTNLYPCDLEVHLLCVEIFLFLRRTDEAQECLIRLVNRIPKELLTVVHLANLRMRVGAYVAATEDFRLLLRAIGPSRLATYLLYIPDADRGEIARVHRQHAFKYLRKHSSYIEAIECFTVAITAVGTMATGLLLARAICYVYLGQYSNALIDFASVLGEDPKNVAALLGKVVMLSFQQNQAALLEQLEFALRLDTTIAIKTAHKLPLPCIQEFCTFLRNLIRNDLTTESEKHGKENRESFERLVLLSKFCYSLFPLSERDFLLHMKCLFHNGQYEDALGELRKAEGLVGSRSMVHSWKGMIIYRLRSVDDSIDALKEIFEEDVETCRDLLQNLRITERQHLRLTCIEKAMEMEKEQLFTQALSMYRVALTTTSRIDLQIHRGRYNCFFRLQDIRRAVLEQSKILELSKTVEEFCRRALCYIQLGSMEEACDDIINAFELDLGRVLDIIREQNLSKSVTNAFLMTAQSRLQEHDFNATIRYCNGGLRISKTNKALRQLRSRARFTMSKCCVQ